MGVPAARRRWLWCLGLVAALIASRAPLAPRYLVTFDSINFALAVDRFNPALHQPQPPGYPLFVLLLKALSSAIPRIEAVFFAAGLLLSLAALLLLWELGDRLLGPGRGIVAALLLLFDPPFWLSPLTNPVRLGYAMGAPAVVLCLFLALDRRSQRWFLLAAAALGLASGFRPDLSLLLAPLVLWTALRLRPGWKSLGASLLLYGICVAAWLPALAAATGGWRIFFDTLREYSVTQTRATSALMGAGSRAAADMAWKAVVWSSVGTLSWIWALPRVLRRRRTTRTGAFPFRPFLLWWFFPGLLFFAVFHVGDADHTLAIVPATCLAGAAVLSSFTAESSPRARTLAILAAVLLNVFLFFKPLSKAEVPSTYKPVRWLDRYMSGVLDTAIQLQQRGGVTVIVYEPVTGWRNIAYYVPEARVIVIREHNHDLPAGWLIHRKQPRDWQSPDGTIRVPACGWLAWIDPGVRPVDSAGRPVESRIYPVSFNRAAAGDTFKFRGFQFLATDGGCPVRP